jgi:hypothetical protein
LDAALHVPTQNPTKIHKLLEKILDFCLLFCVDIFYQHSFCRKVQTKV